MQEVKNEKKQFTKFKRAKWQKVKCKMSKMIKVKWQK